MINVENIKKSFSGQVILDEINLKIPSGEILAILGESGTGKSVLLKTIMGLLKPDGGKVEIDGVNMTKLPERKKLDLRKKIGYLFQEGALYDFMNVFENIAFPLKEHTKLSRGDIKEKVLNVLKVVDLEGVEAKYPTELSGGMKKRVGLARSIILDCKVLLCDEPTSGLDPIRSRDISDLIRDVSKKINCTTVITSHDIENAFRVSDRLALLREGKFVAIGTQQDLESSEDLFVKDFIR